MAIKDFSRNWVIVRLAESKKQTLGRLYVFGGTDEIFKAFTLELPWKDNRRNVSRIPAGEYLVESRFSEKHKEHFAIAGVSGRSGILTHRGNYNSQTQGCILAGRAMADINKDGEPDVTESGKTLADLHAVMPQKFRLKIIDLDDAA
ncbi:MAG TPA: DUF5675 family protein [Candidatus Rifleibacterium sp.]|nr:DUF5675 family protein [Candidatus Rifleibacterium sp.]HPT45899.1 DUF5675 family protein [Candidatus Rifleibacterium sp.]